MAAQALLLTAAILVGVAKVGDALGLVSRIARVGIGADVAPDTVTLGDIDSPLFELSRRFGRRRQKAFNLAFRAPTIVLFQTMTVFIGHAYPSLRLTAAAFDVLAALNIVVVFLVATLVQRYRGGDLSGVAGLFFDRVTHGKPRSLTLSPILVIPMTAASLALGFSALYHAIFVINPHSFATLGGSFGVIPCVYFSIVTSATVGYGDIRPVSSGAQLAVKAQIVATASGLAFFVSYLLADRGTAETGTSRR